MVNLDNLGGYKLGPGQTDGVVQTLTMSGGVWGGCGSYPLEVMPQTSGVYFID